MKKLRRVIFWCHLPLGVIAGLVILTMAITGVLLAYERQIVEWADTRNYTVTAGNSQVSLELILTRAIEARPDASPSMITVKSDPRKPAAVAFGRDQILFVDPYTGEVLGGGSKNVREFFRVVTDWHRWLGAGGENRSTARSITGACNLAFLFLVVSGFYLWLPRTWLQVRNAVLFKRGLSGRARDFNWHNVIGAWSVIPLFIIVISGVVISYTWAGDLVYRLVGETPPARPAAGQSPPAAAAQSASERQPARSQVEAGGSNAKTNIDGLYRLSVIAGQQTTGWRSISLRLPVPAEGRLSFTIDSGNGGQPDKRAQITLDRKTGDILNYEPFSGQSRGRKLRSFLRFAHTGEIAGILGQTIAAAASAGGALLVWTGLGLALRRFRSWLVRMLRRRLESSPAPATQE